MSRMYNNAYDFTPPLTASKLELNQPKFVEVSTGKSPLFLLGFLTLLAFLNERITSWSWVQLLVDFYLWMLLKFPRVLFNLI